VHPIRDLIAEAAAVEGIGAADLIAAAASGHQRVQRERFVGRPGPAERQLSRNQVQRSRSCLAVMPSGLVRSPVRSSRTLRGSAAAPEPTLEHPQV
jgi:hypothetical protein